MTQKGQTLQKRDAETHHESRRKKRKRYKMSSVTTKRRDLGNNARGLLISCAPKHEAQCFRDAVSLLSEFVDDDKFLSGPATKDPTSQGKDLEIPQKISESPGKGNLEKYQRSISDTVTRPDIHEESQVVKDSEGSTKSARQSSKVTVDATQKTANSTECTSEPDKHIDIATPTAQSTGGEQDSAEHGNSSGSGDPTILLTKRGSLKDGDDAGGDSVNTAETDEKQNPEDVQNSGARIKHADVSAMLGEELAYIKNHENALFNRIDCNTNGSIFIQIDHEGIDLEKLVKDVLTAARSSQATGTRHCIRFLPIHATCYAKVEDAAKAAVKVVSQYFPKENASYAIFFKSRMNTGAHREDYIKGIAAAIEKEFPGRYPVSLSNPDVALIIEILKTSCCIGTFREYYQFAKMNIREVVKPPKEKGKTAKEATAVVNSAEPD